MATFCTQKHILVSGMFNHISMISNNDFKNQIYLCICKIKMPNFFLICISI